MANLRSEILLFMIFTLAGTCVGANYDFTNVNKLVKIEQCNVPDYRRIDCGEGGITRERCERKGCCFDDSTRGTTWCYYLNRQQKGVCVLMDDYRDGYVTEDEMKKSGVNYADIAFFDLNGDGKLDTDECYALQLVEESQNGVRRTAFLINWFRYYDINGDGKLTKDELIKKRDPMGDEQAEKDKISKVLSYVGGLKDSDASTLNFQEFYLAYRDAPSYGQLYRPDNL